MRAEHLAQRLVDQVRRRVIGANGRAARVVDDHVDSVAGLEVSGLHGTDVHEQIAELLLRVGDAEQRAVRAFDDARVADLTATFAIERRLRDDDVAAFALGQRRHRLAFDDQAFDDRFSLLGVVAEELGRPRVLLDLEPLAFGRRFARALPGRARLVLLRRHGGVEGGQIDLDAARFQCVLCQIQRKAKRVVQLERHVAGKRVALAQGVGRLVEQLVATRQRLAELDLLKAQRLSDHRLPARQLGKSVTHLAHQRRHETVHQRIFRAEQMRMPHGPAHDAAQHVAAPLVRRQHAFRDQERRGAQVIRDDAMRELLRALGLGPGRILRGSDQRLEEIIVVDRIDALQNAGHALQAHAGID